MIKTNLARTTIAIPTGTELTLPNKLKL